MTAPNRCTILWRNQLTASSQYSSSDEDSNFPATNLFGNDIHTPARSNDTSGTKTWRADMGGVVSYDTIMIAGHNLLSGFSVRAGHDTNNTFTPASIMTRGDNCYIYYWDDPIDDQYVAVSTQGSTTSGFHQIGLLWCGLRTELTYNPQIPIGLIRKKDTTMLTTGGGQLWTYENYTKIGYKMKFIGNNTATAYADIEEIYDDRGMGKPFVFDLKPEDTDTPPIFVHTTEFNFSIDKKNARPGTWTVEEEK